MDIPVSYKFPIAVDELIHEATYLKYDNPKLEEPIRFPISNKRILATLAIDEFIDAVTINYAKKNTIQSVNDYNMYLKERFDSLRKRKMIQEPIRKVNF
ncbi:MAG: hypothetical protein OPY03_04945 [Nitrosopumilus sp.]|nr:hypothetical protein [Nitrosopumilus sp.]